MALTRAQLLAGNQNLGVVLPGQVQAVSQGLGVFIDTDGTISVDASTAEGLVRLNNGNAYNGYIWPNAIGQADQFLQLVDASGQLRWADASGFAVVVVSPNQPTSPDEGELWYNCNTGSLLVYQNCVSPGGWTNVAQPGKEVDPTKTSAVPPFTNQGTPNAGTLANPYDCTVTTTTPGASVFIVNKVTITSLAPYQYVPIVDMNAVANGGRFHFSNNYANAAGVLEFETIFIDLPTSGSGVSYTAAIRVGYATVYIDAVVNVVAPLSCTPGSISGDPVVGNQLTYTQGVASGGIGAYNYTWDWKDSGGNILASNVTTYVPTGAEVGQTIFVELTVTDSAPTPDSVTVTTSNTAPVTALTLVSVGSISGSAATGSTLTYTPGSATGGAAPTNYTWQWKNDLGAILLSGSGTAPQTYVIPATQVGRTIFVAFTATDSATTPNIVSGNTSSTAVISGTPITNVQFPTTIPGTASFTWSNGNGVTLTATDCIEFEVNGAGGFVTSATVGTGNTIVTRWKTTPTCGGAAQGTTINGTLTTSTGLVSSASFTINRLPTGVTLNPTTLNANVGVVITPVNFSTTGANTAPLIWGILSAGTTPEYSIDGGTNWIPLPSSPTATNTIPPGVTALVRYTTAGAGTETLDLRAGLSNTGGQYQSATLTTTVSLAPFPTPTWNPTGSLTTIPGLISGTYSGTGTTITSTGCIEVSTDGINFSQSEPISAPQTLYARWIDVPSSGTCGDAATGTTLNGSVSDGTYQNNYGPVTVNRKPNPFGFTAGSTSAPLSSLQTSNQVTITGINTTAYITLGSLSAGATNLEARVNGGPWTAVPSAPSTALAINDTNQLEIRFVTGSTAGATYTAVVNIGDGDNVQFIASSPGLVVTNTTSAAFPGLSFSPAAAPTASPDYTNLAASSLYGTVTATWPNLAVNPISITSTGSLEFRNVTAGGSFGQGAQTLSTGDTIALRWKLADAVAALDSSTLTGNLTGGIYTNVFSLPVKKLPNAYNWGTVSGASPSSTVTSDTITIANINCPAQLTYTGTAPDPLTSVQAAIAGLAFTNVPLAGNAGLTVNPTDLTGTNPTQIILKALTGTNAPATYGLTSQIGDGTNSTDQAWTAQVTVLPAITTPNITAPTGTNNNPAAFSPAGLTVTGSNYTPSVGNPGAHGSSDWQIVANVGSTTRNPETSGIQTVTQNAAGSWTLRTGTTNNNFAYGAGTYGNGLYLLGGSNNGSASGQLLSTSPDGVTWTDVNTGFTGGIYGMAYGPVGGVGTYVAVCYQGRVMRSTNGSTWLSTTVGPGSSFNSVTYGNGLFVAILSVSGTGGGIYTSPDGASWTQRLTISSPNELYGVGYGNGLFVAVGGGGALGPALIYTSADGLSWTPRATGSPNGYNLRTVSYGSGRFIAAGVNTSNAPYALTSTTGLSWSSASLGARVAGVSSSVYGDGAFVLSGGTNEITYSSDGVTWSQVSLGSAGSNPSFFALAYGNGLFVVGGTGGTTSAPNVYTSTAPAGSTTLTLADTTDLSSMVVGDTVVEVGGGADATGTITAITPGTPSITVVPPSTNWTTTATAKDTSRTVTTPNQPLVSTNQISLVTQNASNWTTAATMTGWSAGQTLNNAAYGNGLWVAVGGITNTSGKYSTSTDGSTWSTQATLPGFTNSASDIAYGNGRWVTVSGTGLYATSTNGTTWTPGAMAGWGTKNVSKVVYANGLWIAAGGASGGWWYSTSTNGTTWTTAASISGGGFGGISGLDYGNGLWVAVGSNGQCSTSTNGTTWTTATAVANWGGTVQDVAYGNGLWVAICGTGAQYSTSTDGITWSSATTIPGWASATQRSVLYANGLWVIIGTGGTYSTSTDGTTWTTGTTIAGWGASNTSGLGYGDGLWIATGADGLYSTATAPAGSTLTISGANTDGFAVGNLVSNGVTGAGAASGTIASINATTVTVTPTSANWANGQNLYRGQTIVNVTNNANLTSYFLPQASLTTSTTYFARVKYNSVNNPPVYSSAFSGWSSFGTAASFVIQPGDQIGGGYFAGQIRVPGGTGTIYNLIVAPVRGDNIGPNPSGTLLGQYSTDGGATPAGIQWKTTASAETGGNIAQAQDLAYGGTWTATAGGTTTSGLGGNYPLFGWCKNSSTGPNGGGGIGGFTDWYIPAKNELEVLYYYFKPTNTGTDPNTIFSGSNPNAVAPEPVSTNYTTTNPAQTTASIFQGTNAQAFDTANQYWSSTEASSSTTSAWLQSFFNGNQGFNGKDGTKYARAVRRVAA